MPADFFQFKQFRIEQAGCAMKVTTEGCILGAIINLDVAKKVLDIGTGTGLLALMMAQRSTAQIDAVEINERCAMQAEQNFQRSQRKDHIRLFHADIREFRVDSPYDLIVSNPPFYKNQLRSPKQERNLAMHDEFLSQEALANSLNQLLAYDGRCYVLYPEQEAAAFAELMNSLGFTKHYHLDLRHKKNSAILRVVQGFSLKDQPLSRDVLVIKNDQDDYSNEFKSLLKDYYSNL